MNLKERGITVGDLIIIILIIVTSTIVVKTFNKNKNAALYTIDNEKISHRQIFISKNHLNNLTL